MSYHIKEFSLDERFTNYALADTSEDEPVLRNLSKVNIFVGATIVGKAGS
jgi:hypothetical protein